MPERRSPQTSLYGSTQADPNQQRGRDLRLDLFRGLALLFIFIDHIPNNVLSYITLHSVAFSDAAEVYSEDFGIDNFIDEPQIAIIKVLLLQYQPQFLDILPIYMVLLGVFPLVLLLLERCLSLPLILSGTIYLLTLHFGWEPHSYPDNEAWYFNPLAWQFLFVIGATAGYAPYSRRGL